MLALTVIYHYKLAEAVPLDGSASYAEIAAKSGVREETVFRFIRAAMGSRVFAEDARTGRVQHTAISRLLATNPGFGDALGLQMEELGPAGAKVPQAFDKWGYDAKEPHDTAFSIYNGDKGLSTYQVLGANPARAKRFGSAMHFYTQDDTWHLRHLVSALDWTALDQPGARLIDVGGGMGQVSQFLAQHTNHLSFVVQDLPHVVPGATQALPEEFKGRISFQVQDFLKPQPAVSADQPAADAVLLRWVLHNWHDAYCVQILRALIPALKPGAKILVYEYVLDDAPVLDQSGRFGLQLDMIMLACFNAQERTAKHLQRLLAQADPRFVFNGVRRAQGSTMSLVEATWTP